MNFSFTKFHCVVEIWHRPIISALPSFFTSFEKISNLSPCFTISTPTPFIQDPVVLISNTIYKLSETKTENEKT